MKGKIVFLIIGFLFSALSAGFGEGVFPAAGAGQQPQTQQEAAKDEKISLDLQGADINELFRILALKSGLTIIATPQVQGRVTVFLNNLSFEDAFDVIITKENLAYERRDNLIKVMTQAEYEKAFGAKFGERKNITTVKLKFAKPASLVNIIGALKSDVGKIIVDEPSGTLFLIDTAQATSIMEQAIKELDQPLETAVFDLNYAKTPDVKTYINELITPGVGQAIVDERSNKVIVTDLPQRLAKISQVVKELDESSRQVLITGEIIQVTLADKFTRGIDWEKALSERRVAGLDFKGSFPTPSASSSSQKISVGNLDRNKYSVVLKFLQEYGDTKILSRPRLVVVNKEEAKILVGSREAYITQTLSQAQDTTVTAESIQFVDVGVKLKVTPAIGKDGFITMKIKPEVSSVRETLTTSGGSQVPIVETSETETVVKVKDGTMIMIAGLMKEEKRDTITGVPALSKMPLIGGLFGNREKSNPVTELVIFLTPQIISGEGEALKQEAKNETE